MKIKLTHVFVEDQAKALEFYTETLGFVKKLDFPVGEYRWLTVASPEEPNGTQLLLEPNDSPIAQTYNKSMMEAGLPAIVFNVDDVQAEYDRLQKRGVTFTMPPTKMGVSTSAILNDTCGNLVQLTQV